MDYGRLYPGKMVPHFLLFVQFLFCLGSSGLVCFFLSCRLTSKIVKYIVSLCAATHNTLSYPSELWSQNVRINAVYFIYKLNQCLIYPGAHIHQCMQILFVHITFLLYMHTVGIIPSFISMSQWQIWRFWLSKCYWLNSCDRTLVF